MDEIQNDWNALDDKKEIEILKKYAYIMNVFTIIISRKKGKIFRNFI